MHTTAILGLAIGALACGNDKSSDRAPSSGPARVSNRELAAASRTVVASTAGGVAFTIELPATLLKPATVEGTYATWEPKQAWFDTPSFTVQHAPMPLGPDETGATEIFADDAAERAITRAEKLPDGGFLHLDERKDHAFFSLQVCRPVGTGRLCCSVSQRTKAPLEGYAEILGLAEAICRSMKPAA